MINEIKIKNFKCLNDINIVLGKITVLSGLNGMGKSTFIQSILLLHQSAIDLKDPLSHLVRNGSMVALGTAKDLLWEGADEECIEFGLAVEDATWDWKFILNRNTNEFQTFSCINRLPTDIGLFSERLQYLRAERWGPRTSFPISNSEVNINRHLGRDGEFAAFFLAQFAETIVENSHVHHPAAVSKQLGHQVEAWLGEISPGTRLYTTPHHSLDLVSLEFAFATGRGETNRYRATNVGFGMSYILPVILAALSSPPNTLLLIENPESHLHPQGQRKMGELLGLASLGNVQLIVETHSDHFLNGLRIAVHEGMLPPDNIALHFFERQNAADFILSTVKSPKIDRNGRIDYWPDGFFDENEKALRKLIFPAQRK